jgi:hypothetical protein
MKLKQNINMIKATAPRFVAYTFEQRVVCSFRKVGKLESMESSQKSWIHAIFVRVWIGKVYYMYVQIISVCPSITCNFRHNVILHFVARVVVVF